MLPVVYLWFTSERGRVGRHFGELNRLTAKEVDTRQHNHRPSACRNWRTNAAAHQENRAGRQAPSNRGPAVNNGDALPS
jgi:hypothetical protein